jgi:hypothetical protein
MPDIDNRVQGLERRVRQLQLGLAAAVIALFATLLGPHLVAQGTDTIVRVRGLIIEDSNGRPRISMGAPIPNDGRTTNLRTGMRINDPNGVERFGLSLFEDSRVVMGFDAPPGKGDDGNRERITLVADQEGGATLSFKDRRTYVGARLYLDEQNRVWMEFSDVTQTPMRRRMGLTGEEVLRTQ